MLISPTVSRMLSAGSDAAVTGLERADLDLRRPRRLEIISPDLLLARIRGRQQAAACLVEIAVLDQLGLLRLVCHRLPPARVADSPYRLSLSRRSPRRPGCFA